MNQFTHIESIFKFKVSESIFQQLSPSLFNVLFSTGEYTRILLMIPLQYKFFLIFNYFIFYVRLQVKQ